MGVPYSVFCCFKTTVNERLAALEAGSAAFNPASPGPIGGTTPDSASFTQITLGTSGILTGGVNQVFQRNGTNPQNFYVFNTYTDAANYERAYFGYSSNVLKIGHENAGTGIGRAIEFVAGGATRLTIATTGAITAAISFLSSGSITAGNTSFISFASRSKFKSSADGIFTLFNAAETDFSRLTFGGTTSAFPSLKRSGTDLQVRLADDTAFSSLAVLSLGATSTITGVGYINGSASRYTWQGQSAMKSPSDGVITIENQAGSDFGRLQFGGTTNAFPALKRSGSALQVRYADDAGFALLEGAGFYGYNAFTDSSNYERGFLRYSANILQIGHEYLGTGVSRQIDFITGAATRLTILSNGNVSMGGTFTALANVTTGGSSYFTWSSRSAMGSGANGNIALYNASVNDFGLLQFGGTINTFPAIKRNATDLQVKLADDSAFAGIEAGSMVPAYNVADPVNYERATIRYVSNVLRFEHQGIGTGVTARAIVLRTGGVDCLTINTNGTAAFFSSVSATSFSSTGAVIAAANLGAGSVNSIYWTSRSKFKSPSDGVILLSNAGDTDFNMLQWGGSTSVFPAIKRSSTALQIKLADDSAFAPIDAADHRSYNLFTDASNYERSFMRWNTNVLEIGTEFLGTGVTRGMNFVVNGVARLLIATNGNVSTSAAFAAGGTLSTTNTSQIAWSGRSRFTSPVDGNITMYNGSVNNFNMLQWGGTTSSFPALKRDSIILQARLADDSAFGYIQGKLMADNAYTPGAPAATGYITVYDSSGTAYKVLVAP